MCGKRLQTFQPKWPIVGFDGPCDVVDHAGSGGKAAPAGVGTDALQVFASAILLVVWAGGGSTGEDARRLPGIQASPPFRHIIRLHRSAKAGR